MISRHQDAPRPMLSGADPVPTRPGSIDISPGVPRPWLQTLGSPTGVFFTICGIVLVLGWLLPLHRYITPKTGLGYVLGIVGGSSMLVLVLYPARKRWQWLAFIGSIKAWFHAHMVLGLIGPILILYHSDFSLGATNSNVALLCMLAVSGSGLIGRYLYTRVHYGMTERTRTLAELQANAERLRTVSLSVSFMPELLQRVERAERQLLRNVPACPVLLQPWYAACLSWFHRQQLNRYVRRALRTVAAQSTLMNRHQPRLLLTARSYVRQRLSATKEVTEFQAYTRLFSMWHLLHVPLFFMLLIAGVVHVIAVHVY